MVGDVALRLRSSRRSAAHRESPRRDVPDHRHPHRAARSGRGRVREPLPVDHRRAHARRAQRPVRDGVADLCACGRVGRAARSDLGAGTAGRRRADRCRASRRRSVPRRVRTRSVFRGRRAADGGRISRRGAGDAAVRRAARGPRRRDQPRPLPGARGRVPGRRARVHAEDRAHRAEPRHPRERRGISQAFTTDACVVQRTAGPLRRHAADRRDVRVRPGVEAPAFPGLPGAGWAERLVGARGTVPARDRGPRREAHAGGPGIASTTSSR